MVTTLYEDLKKYGHKEFNPEEELILLKAAQDGDKSAQNLLLSTMYFAVLNLAGKIAGPTTTADTFDDIIGAGIEGALTAIRRYSTGSPTARLRTFANAHIRGMILREISKNYSPLTIPHNSVGEAIALASGRTPGDLGITDKKAFSLRSASLPQAEFPACDVEQDPFPIHLDSDFELLLRSVLDQLDPDAHFVVCHSYGILGFAQMSRSDIAKTYGLTVRETTQLLEEAVSSLEELLGWNQRGSST